MKWHPDRNHGREDEVKDKFVAIQSAQEVLLDKIKRAKYDAERRTRQNTRPSNVKGNPYQNMSNQFPRPPQRSDTQQRPPMPTRPATSTASGGGKKYQGWASSVPNGWTGNQPNARDNARAWEEMRQPSSNKNTQSGPANGSPSPRKARRPDPPPTPRTYSQRQKAEASFGTRRTGFAPASPMGDEAPVTKKNYSTTRMHTSMFDGPSPFDDPAPKEDTREVPMDEDDILSAQFGAASINRERMPYTSNPGERTTLYPGVNRAGTVKDPRPNWHTGDSKPATGAHQRRASFGEPNGVKTNAAQQTKGFGNDNKQKNSPRSPAANDFLRPQKKSGQGSMPRSAPATATFPPTAEPQFPSNNGQCLRSTLAILFMIY
jgi:curved DNA-binding protein CbpA